MKCSDEPSENPFALCGNSSCVTCYPDDRLRAMLNDLLDANRLLQSRVAELAGVRESLVKSEGKVDILKSALLRVGSSEVTGDTAPQVMSCVRKIAVDAIVHVEKASEEPEIDDCED